MASRRFSQVGGAAGSAPLPGYRIVVVASTVSHVVEAAGGFLCDRARAGWEVSVLLAGACDPRPLTVLGVSECSAGDAVSVIGGLPHGARVMVGADLLRDDAQARDALSRFTRQGCGGVRIWGGPAQAEVDNGLEPDPHRLSRAAIAFKAHALRVVRNQGIVEPVEMLYRVRGESYRRLHSV
jgi:hypothetical protein